MLSNNGYDSKQADDGETALQILRVAAMEGKPFHIAVLDEQMPGMDGLELGRRIKADPLIRSTRLIVMTPVGQRVDTTALEALDGAIHLAKPIRQTPLLNSVATAMKKGTATRPDETTNAIAKPAFINNTKLRILLAEDNPVNQKVALSLLAKAGFQADVVDNGRQAVAALATKQYDLVLMDCQMPEMDGFKATATIRDPQSPVLNHAIPIIALTANAMAGDREKCLAAGMNDYLPKPINGHDLCSKIEQYSINANAQAVPATVLDTAGAAVMDTASALEWLDGDIKLFLITLSAVRSQIASDRHDIASAMTQGESKQLRKAAHRLKGSIAQIGAMRAKAVCQELEAAAAQDELTACSKLKEQLDQELDALLPAIDGYLADHPDES